SDLSWTKKIRHPGEVVKKGDEIEVVVLNVDRQNRRISLGYKQTQNNPWDEFEFQYKPGTQVEGKVVRLIEKGLLTELPEGVDGFVPMSQLAKENLSKPADGYQIDDVLTLTVIEFNKESKKIVLSEKKVANLEEAKSRSEAEVAEAEEEFAVEAPKKQYKKTVEPVAAKTEVVPPPEAEPSEAKDVPETEN
ncbi:MAG: S1 RNA-binding domain-containing protein, partial [Calditrichaeota bacterium]